MIIPIIISALEDRWIFGDLSCVLMSLTTSTLYAVTLATLTMMVVDKYFTVQFPLRYQTVLSTNILMIELAVLWILPICFIIVTSYILNFQHSYSQEMCSCSIQFSSVRDSQTALPVGFICGAFVAFVYLFCNVQIYKISRRHLKRVGDVSRSSGNDIYNSKGLKTILVTTMAAVCSLVPVACVRSITWMGLLNPPVFIIFISNAFVFCNSFVNCFIYLRTHALYREEHLKVWRTVVLYLR